jgi:hypothetical protein
MLTHVHKVIHLVVGTFDQGWWSCGEVCEVEEVTSVTGRRTRLWTCAFGQLCWEGRGVGLWLDAGASGDLTRQWCVLLPMMYVDASCFVKKWGVDAGAHPVRVDLTRPVTVLTLGELSGNDLRLGGRVDRRVRSSIGGTHGSIDLTRSWCIWSWLNVSA